MGVYVARSTRRSCISVAVLPPTRGRIRPQADLSTSNWFQVGGCAEYLFKPADAEDLAQFLKEKPADLEVTIIGVGSNLIVRDGGIKGVVVRLGRGFTELSVISSEWLEKYRSRLTTHDSQLIAAGAACLDVHVAQFAAEAGIAGLEFLSGIPGTIGGAVAMNAGAYGREIADVLVEAEIVDAQGNIRTLSNAEMGFTYRHSQLPEGAIVTRALLQGVVGDKTQVIENMKEIQAKREATQPIRSRTGGSTFQNPPGKKAWELIDQAGCRGLTLGGAQVSEKHCNFLINTGSATAADLEALGEEVRTRVRAHSGVELEWEIKRIGEKKP